jgi:uncharacterized membrane protein YfcA
MQIYLPVAELPISILVLLGLGGGVGILSGMFGVGGGFLLTPSLIFLGVPTAVAVASQAPEAVATTMSGVLTHRRRGNVDLHMGLVLLLGGITGSATGVQVFAWLRQIGQADVVVGMAFVLVLGTVGTIVLIEASRRLLHRGVVPRRKLHQHLWLHALPFKMRFRRSRLYISVLPPFAIGCFAGFMAAIMGIGGGFIMVPAMIYLLGMPTLLAVGTSLFNVFVVNIGVTVMHANTNQTVDVVLALIIAMGGIVGAQLGARIGPMLKAEQLRLLLGGVVLAVCVRVAWTLVATPDDVFSLGKVVGR